MTFGTAQDSLRQQILKHKAQKILQRRIALVGLRTEQGSLPAIEHESGEYSGFGRFWQLACLHGLAKHGSDASLPLREVETKAALQHWACFMRPPG